VPDLPDSYDEVRYPSLPRNQSHPAFISALSTIAGLKLPPVDQWSVLEIGCGDGSNILPLAFDYPEGKFVGVDRALKPIDAGRALAGRLQLANIKLQNADLIEWQPEGEFDYIVAHGVFSWVPEEIRERILQLCAAALKPRGVAYISYNALPGCHFRRFAGDFLRFHVRHQSDPAACMEKARSLARQIISQPVSEEPLELALRSEMESVLKRDDTALYHDDLALNNEPFYLLDFVARAARHGLQYLGDSDPQRDDVQGTSLLAEDWLESRQYGDFLAKRRFRETLLCRKDIHLDRKLLLDRFRDLFVASRVRPAEAQKDGQQRFELPKSRSLTTNHPFAKEALCRLASLWPGSMKISELPLDQYSPDSIADLLMRLHDAGAIELRTHPPKIAAAVSECPAASALARAQIAEGCHLVTNQRHMSIELEDEHSRRVLSLLDGSRDRRTLARELSAAGMDPVTIGREIEDSLIGLHRLCLLTA
jgi:SAM-dependent methyltransferase